MIGQSVRAQQDWRARLGRHGFRGWLPAALAILFALPRAAPSYGGYLLAGLLVVDYRASRRSYVYLALLGAGLLASFAGGALLGSVSPTAFLLEWVLLTPMLLFLSGFKTRLTDAETTMLFRFISLLLCGMSLLNIALSGFKLPYVHTLPDVFGALYGSGGARIVTIAGFVALTRELSRPTRNWFFTVVAAVNFVVPSYVIGLVAGAVAITVAHLRNTKVLLLIGVAVLLAVPYGLGRLDRLNDTFTQTFGYPAKVYAYIVPAQVMADQPLRTLVGTGAGQFSSTPALWASSYIRPISGHDVPPLPGLAMSSAHQEYLGPLLTDRAAIRSAANKPYTSISTIITEFGLPLAILVVWLFAVRALQLSTSSFGRAVVIFTILLLAVDVWHDTPWLSALLLFSTRAEHATGSADSPTGGPSRSSE